MNGEREREIREERKEGDNGTKTVRAQARWLLRQWACQGKGADRLSLSGRNFSKLDCFPLEFVLTLSSRAKESSSSLAKTVGVGLELACYLPLLLPHSPPLYYTSMPSLPLGSFWHNHHSLKSQARKLMIIIAEVEQGTAGVVCGQRITC